MSAGSSSMHYLDAAARQIQIVMDHQQPASGNLKSMHDFAHGFATSIHEGERFTQQHPVCFDSPHPPGRMVFPIPQRNRKPPRQSIEHPEARIMSGIFIMLSGISQTHNGAKLFFVVGMLGHRFICRLAFA